MSLIIFAAALAACCVGCSQVPTTKAPEVPLAPAFKEAAGPWVTAQPSDELPRQAWWSLYRDPELDALQQRLQDNSPDLASALAHYQQARAATDVLRAAQSPTLSTSLNVQRDRQSERRPLRVLGPTSPDDYNSATLGLDFEYEVDFWGRVRQQVSAGEALEQAAQADLANARLALQARLADTLIALRGLDQEAVLLKETEAAYLRAADTIDRRHQGGIASGLDLSRAQNQLESTRSQLRQQQAQRAVLEHAIAALVGANPSTFTITPRAVEVALPTVPVGVPSELLQRRPDVAAAQRRVVAATASVGVARSAVFPSLTLSAVGGYQSSDLDRFIQAPNLFWAIGPTLLVNLLDGGKRKAEIARTEAALDEVGQTYRGVVLGAFQQVEDQLALLSQYGEAAASERRATDAAQRSLDLASNRYREGVASYLDVVTAQTANLQARRNALDLATRQRRASVQLVRALGGGWDGAELTAGEPRRHASAQP